MAKKLTTNLTLNVIARIRRDSELQIAMDEWVKWNLSHPTESWTLRDWLKEKEVEIKSFQK